MNIFPKKPQFFVMFDEIAKNLEKEGVLLEDLYKHTSRREKTALTIRSLEEKTDAIVHNIIHESELAFITPIDREDLHLLANNLDDLTDTIEDVAVKIVLYNGKLKPTADCVAFIACIKKTTHTLSQLIQLMKFREKKRSQMKEYIASIHDDEHESDVIYRRAVKKLFSKTGKILSLIKWKDLYESMEIIMDRTEVAADTIDLIAIKNY